jgi:hypothetical protein
MLMLTNAAAIRIARLSVALAIVVALTAQFVLGLEIASFRTSNFFSYFTVLSNVIAAGVLLVLAADPTRTYSHAFGRWRGAATLYMAVTGVVYVTVLLPLDTDVGVSEPWIDLVIHGIGPVFMVVDWLVGPPPNRIAWRELSYWLAFPIIYLVYTLVRGPMADWYPYPFLDPREDGYVPVAVGALLVLVTMVVLGAALLAWARRRSRTTARLIGHH